VLSFIAFFVLAVLAYSLISLAGLNLLAGIVAVGIVLVGTVMSFVVPESQYDSSHKVHSRA
jgi:hypothetical protein